jgi:hypothetical protein
MAAGRPVASTPIADVVDTYGDIVYVGEGPQGFVVACERALGARPAERRRRSALADRALAGTSWDATVARMEELLADLAEPLDSGAIA